MFRNSERGLEGEVNDGRGKRALHVIRVLLLVCDGKIAIRKRPPGGLLGDMWELPSLPNTLTPDEAQDAATELGASPLRVARTRHKTHIFTHVTWHMTAHEIPSSVEAKDLTWATKKELAEHYGLPTAFRKFL